jgi:hypothetical protein
MPSRIEHRMRHGMLPLGGVAVVLLTSWPVAAGGRRDAPGRDA